MAMVQRLGAPGRNRFQRPDRPATLGRLSRDLDWRAELKRHDDKAELERLRLATSTGRPWTSEPFLKKLETDLGRRLHALAPEDRGNPH